MPGLGEPASNIGIGANGAVWANGRDGGIYQWKNNRWVRLRAEKLSGTIVSIAVNPNGYPWVVTTGIGEDDKLRAIYLISMRSNGMRLKCPAKTAR